MVAMATGILTYSTTSAAGSYVGTILSVQGYGENVNAVFIYLSGDVNGSPACALGEPARFVINPSNPSGQALLAIVLAALARGAGVGFTGSGSCDIWPDTESVLLLNSN